MTYLTELSNKQFQQNIIVEIEGVFYGGNEPDSGLTILAENLGLVNSVKIPRTSVELRRSRTTLGSISFQLLDKNEIVSTNTMGDASNWLEKTVKIHAGFITGSFDFSEYILLSTNIIRNYSKVANSYSFTAEAPTSLLLDPTFQIFSEVSTAINDTDTSVVLEDATDFPTSGAIRINEEYILYSGKSGDTLTGLSRGDESSTATNHDIGEEVVLITEVDENIIDILLRIILSDVGDMSNSSFDTLTTGGLGVPQAQVDITSFTDIRDSSFPSDDYRFLLQKTEKTLTFFEDEILQATNTRLIVKNGLISLAILDQITLGDEVGEVDETSIVGNPKWKIGSNKIVNEIRIKWNYSWGLNKFGRTNVFTDADSVTRYGLKKPLELEFRGVISANNGAAIVTNRGARLLERLSTARPDISITAHFSESQFDVADDIRVTHRYIPQQGGTLGFSDQLEILSKSVDFNTGIVRYDLQFTSFSGLRIGLIAPSPNIVSFTDQKTITVPDGSCYKPGYVLRLWSDTLNDYLPDPLNIVDTVNGNILTMVNDFSTTLLTTQRLRFPIYDNANEDQIARFAFSAPNTGFFDDGTKAYEIIF